MRADDLVDFSLFNALCYRLKVGMEWNNNEKQLCLMTVDDPRVYLNQLKSLRTNLRQSCKIKNDRPIFRVFSTR